MDNIYPKCCLCGCTPSKGLYDGLRLNGKFICSDCEEHIMEVEIGSEEYYRSIQNMRAILYG